MNLKNFTIKIASVPDREEVVAEIYYDHEQWVEISQEDVPDGPLTIQFYAPFDNKPYWEFPLDEAMKALEQAKKRLLGMGGKKT